MKKTILLGAIITALVCFAIAYFYKEPDNEKIKLENLIKEVRVKTEDEEEITITDKNINDEFYITEITDELFEKMLGKSYKENTMITRNELRYVHVLHYGFDGETREGELVCNKFIADSLCDIFKKLYTGKYQIEKIKLVDEYNADDELSMEDNNSSCFNFRLIAGTNRLSKHGEGMAIDINTLYNPYIKDGEYVPINAGEYLDRENDFPHKIDENDLCYKLFNEAGFEWGGSWDDIKDYQHFEVPSDIINEYHLSGNEGILEGYLKKN